jgi:thioredoxin
MAVKQQFKNLDEVLAKVNKPVLVDFYAEWCGPCRMMATVLEDVNRQMRDRIQIVKINAEAYPDLASTYQIGAYPTVLLFHQGQVVERIEGLLPAPELIATIERAIS